MTLRSSVVLLVAALVVSAFTSSAAFAQDDDDLAPLAPLGKPKPKAKPKPKPKTPTNKTKPAPVSDDDDLAPIAPIAAKGDLNVKGPAGSTLSIDGKEVGELPLGPQNIASGEHTVTVKRPGFAAFVKKVLVPGGKTVDLDAKLTAVAAVLSVTSDVPGAQVLLNGRPIGTVPLNDVEVPPGPAEVAVIKDGFKEESQKINFQVGKEYPIVVKFSAIASNDRPTNTNLVPNVGNEGPVAGVSAAPAEPITSKWYFWAGIAAAVVAVGVGVGAGVAAGQPPPLTERDICGADGCDGCIGLSCQAGFRPMGSF
jgi:hypothetical protein